MFEISKAKHITILSSLPNQYLFILHKRKYESYENVTNVVLPHNITKCSTYMFKYIY